MPGEKRASTIEWFLQSDSEESVEEFLEYAPPAKHKQPFSTHLRLAPVFLRRCHVHVAQDHRLAGIPDLFELVLAAFDGRADQVIALHPAVRIG